MLAKKLSGVMGATVAIALVVVALWGWGQSRVLVAKADNPQLALWAVRSAAIAALAAKHGEALDSGRVAGAG